MKTIFIIHSWENGWYSNEKTIEGVYDTKPIADKYLKEFEDKTKEYLESKGKKYGDNNTMEYDIEEWDVIDQ